MKNSRGFLIAVAVILAVALVLFAAHTGLASTAQSNEEAAFSQMLELMMPGGAPFEELEYTGSDSSITAVYGAANGNYVVQTSTDGFNGLLTNLFRCVRDKPDLLINALRYVLNSREDFERVLEKPVLLDPTLNRRPEEGAEEKLMPKAPGMKYKHYAPKAEMIVFEGESRAVEQAIEDEKRKRETEGGGD